MSLGRCCDPTGDYAMDRRPIPSRKRHTRREHRLKRIVAIGGGGFLLEAEASLLDRYLLALTDRAKPKVCFVPTASGDAQEDLQKFYRAFAPFSAELSHLAFFGTMHPQAIPLGAMEQRLAEQQLIYVGRGNTRSMLAVWREWGLVHALRRACEGGTILAGVSAGAICWFEWGASDSMTPGQYGAPLRCLGFLKGSCAPHCVAGSYRRRDFHRMLRAGEIPAGYGIGDGAALLFQDGRLADALASRPDASAQAVEFAGGRLRETELRLRLLRESEAR
jgi:peptidase E